MARFLIVLVAVILLCTAAMGYTFSRNNIGGSICFQTRLISPRLSADLYYHRGFRLSEPWSVRSLEFTRVMFFVGPVVLFDSRLLGRGLEFGISGRVFTGIETLRFKLFGNYYMPAIGLRGSFTFSLKTLTFSLPRIFPSVSFIDMSKITRVSSFSISFCPLPFTIGFDSYF